MRRSVMTTVCVIVILAASVRPAWSQAAAESPVKSPGDAATRVAAAHRAGETLDPLASRDHPDAWLVTDVLCDRGERDAALAFARTVRGKHLEGLAAYVAAWMPDEADAAVRDAVRMAEAALAGKDPAGALEALADVRPRAGTVLAARVPFLRGVALQGLRRYEAGATEYGASGTAAEEIGWLRRAAFAYSRASACAHARSDPRAALRWEKSVLRIWLMRPDHHGRPFNESATRISLGGIHESLAEFREARDHLERAIEILEPLRTRDLQHAAAHAAALTNLARVHRGLGDATQAVRLLERSLALNEEYRHRPGIAWALAMLGETEWKRGSAAAALPHLERALKLMREEKDGRGEAFVLMRLGAVQRRRGETAAARKSLEEALDVARRAGSRWEEAASRHWLGLMALNSGSPTNALEHLRAAGDLYRAIGDRRTESWLLADLADALSTLGETVKATETLERAVEVAGDHRPALANALRHQADLLVRRGAFDRSGEVYRRAGRLYEALGDRSGLAKLRNSEGALLWYQGRLRGALAAFEEARRVLHETGDRVGETDVLENLALVHGSLGNHAEAVELHERCLGILVESGDVLGEALCLSNLSIPLARLGRSADALTGLERARRLAADAGDRRLEARVLANLAGRRIRLGEVDRAREEIAAALRAHEEAGDRFSLAWTRVAFAVLLEEDRRYGEARSLLEVAVPELEAIGARRSAAQARLNLGVLDLRTSDWPSAGENFRKARAELEALGDPSGALLCAANLAHLHGRRGRFAEQESAYRKVIEDAERLQDLVILAQARSGLAEALAARGDHAGAVESARRAAEVFRLLVRGFGEEQGASLRSRTALRYGFIHHGALSALHLEDAESLCYFLETGRAGTLLESLDGRDRLREATIPAELRKAEEEARLAEREALVAYRVALAGGQASTIRESRRTLDARREGLRDAVGRIQRGEKENAGILYPEADSLADIRESLRAGEALVAYGIQGDALVALVVTPSKARTVDLGAGEDVVGPASLMLRPGRAGARGLDLPDRVAVTEEQRAGAVDELRRRVVDPLGLGPDTRRVLISPDGILSYVPFCLLLGEKEVVHVPSGTAYRRLVGERSRRGKGVLALGDPDYSGDGDPTRRVASRFGRTLERLPASRKEAVAVGDVVLLGEKATERGFREALGRRPRWRAVHLACHGLVDAERPALSALALTPDAEDDGLLDCLDLYRMEIPGDLVVLSACETGRGKVYAAEGIVGLTRAFIHAGAPRVICSLWNVDDRATSALMVKFYELWKGEGLSTAAALRGAQEHVRAQPGWEAPYFWAAWVLWGLGD